MNTLEKSQMESRVIEILETCFDPEIPVNVYELGLVYAIDVAENADVRIEMTLTAPNCPVATSLPGEIQSKVAAIPGIGNVTVDVVWDPPWNPSRMTESAKLQLGLI